MSEEKERKVRKARRVELRGTLGFSSGEVAGDATITNISTAGCRAESDVNLAREVARGAGLTELATQIEPAYSYCVRCGLLESVRRALLFDNRHRHLNPFVRKVVVVSR